MIHLLDNDQLTESDSVALSFLQSSRACIFNAYRQLIGLNRIQKRLMFEAFNEKTKKENTVLFADMKSDNSLKIKEKLDEYMNDLAHIAQRETICCSSDTIESYFGKYEEVVKGNKTVGISDLCFQRYKQGLWLQTRRLYRHYIFRFLVRETH